MVATTDRPAAFKASLAALNAQFAAWVASSAASAPHALWTDAARDYVKHAAGLVEDYKDVLGGGGGERRAADASGGAVAHAFLVLLLTVSLSLPRTQARLPGNQHRRRRPQV
jgi:hypothetical protein